MQPKFDALYRSIVTSNIDASNSGKIKVQCPQISGLAEIRFAEPANPQMPVPNVGTTVWLGFSGGDITKPFYISNLNYLYLSADKTSLVAQSLTSGTTNDSVQILLESGIDGAATGTTNPSIRLLDGNHTTVVDIRLSGNILKTDASGTYQGWHSPTMGTGWATGSGVGGSYPPLMWRYDIQDNVHLFGTFHATSTTPSTVIATTFPLISIGGNVGVAGVAGQINNTSSVTMPSYINGSGELRSAGTPTGIAVNDTFMINAIIPIGNLS